MNYTIFLIVLYMAAQVVIGFWASRFVKTEKDYVLAGRTVGFTLAMFSMFATNFGAESVMGSASAVADEGLSGARADPFGYTLCWILMALLVAYQLRSRQYMTIGDFFKDRYSRAIELLFVIVVLPSSLVWAAAQLMAFGQIFTVVSGISLDTGVIFATCLVVFYTFMGGIMGDIMTDFLQGIILILGVIVLGYFVMDHAGGFIHSLSLIQPEQLTFKSVDETLLQRFDVWLVPVLGSLVMQEAVSRILATKSPEVARRAALGSAFMYLAIGIVPVYIALVGTHFDLPIDHKDAFLPNLAQNILPPAVYIIFTGALISAILSTVDSTVLAFSTLVSNNIIFPLMKNPTGKQELRINRALVLVAGFLAGWMALSGDSIFEMAQLSSSFGSAGVLVTFFAGLWFQKQGGSKTAGATLITGIAVSALGAFVYDESWEAPFLYAIIASVAVFAAGMMLEKGHKLFTHRA